MGEFLSMEWLDSLRSYSAELRDAFSFDLSRLSGTGIRVNSEDRITLLLQESQIEHSRHQRQRHLVAPLIEDLKQLNEWLEEPSDPLLLVAPFGAGKSVLLAHFACKLAGDVLRWCDDPKDRALPPVPLPVRLRDWMTYDERRLFVDFVREDSQKVLGLETKLSASQIRALAQANALLPLYDGFDELPSTADIRRRAFYEMGRFSSRYVLSSRPGHGAEEGIANSEDSRILTLTDLTQEDAERFICQQLNIPVQSCDAMALIAYREARPHINDLFRRPLCLAAWCDAYPANSKHPPASLSDMLYVVLQKVLDQRLSRDMQNLGPTSVEEILAVKYKLGAVLAAYAELGFSTPCTDRQINTTPTGIADTIEFIRWRSLAVSSGLLVRSHGGGFYTIKIPVVEYLIGSYYAWLTIPLPKTENQDQSLSRQREFVARFRTGVWWRDFDEIWLYAFDQLWQGTDEQVEIAAAIVEWLLGYSKQCKGDSLPDQRNEASSPEFVGEFWLGEVSQTVI